MRAAPGAADRRLIEQLAERGLTASPAQLERWRRAGLLPRNTRHGRGRGRGSVATAEPQTVEIAAALARHARQGRDLRLAVVDWFAEAGLALPPAEPVPDPPAEAVRTAIVWVFERNRQHRLVRIARSAATEAERDAFYTAAEQSVRRGGAPAPRPLDPDLIRQSLLSGTDVPDNEDPVLPDEQQAAMIHLTASLGMGIDEVGPELFAASLMQLGMIPSSITAAELASLLADPTRSIHLREALATTSASDELEAVRRADAAQLRRARTVANGLAGFGAIYLMHGLLMPDTPGFAELRSRIDELGLRDLLMALGPSMRSTAGFVSTVVSCLSPWMSNLYDTLLDGVEKGPGLLHGPDDQHTAAKFIDEWMGTIAKLRSERGDSDSSM